MTHNWKPGDVALRTGRDGTTRISFFTRTCHSMYRPHWHHDDGGWDRADDPEEFYTYRPLLVIDPENREQVSKLSREVGRLLGDIVTTTELQAALRSLLEPEPEEPTRFLAEVEDGQGKHWFRVYERGALPWVARVHNGTNGMHLQHDDDGLHATRAWSDIPRPITVLPEGWQGAIDE